MSRRFDVDSKRVLIRCCRECNTFLSNSFQQDLEERRRFALNRFNAKKKKKIL